MSSAMRKGIRLQRKVLKALAKGKRGLERFYAIRQILPLTII